jgi:hypothetical protein
MKIINRKTEEAFIQSPDFHNTETRWEIILDDNDLPDPKMLTRFRIMIVTQRIRHNKPIEASMTWFKGTHTNIFDKRTKDPQKQFVIQLLEHFLQDNSKIQIQHYNALTN